MIEPCICIGTKSWKLSDTLKTDYGEEIWVHAECGRVSYPWIKECETCEKVFVASSQYSKCRICEEGMPKEELNRILAKYGIK